jgi:membrane protease YdiL (CAAX protease family)
MKYPKLREAVRVGGVEINLRMAVVLCLVVILTMAYGYHSRFLETWLRPVGLESLADGAVGVGHTQFLLFFVVPLTAVLLMGDSPRDYGLRIGNWKEGLTWLAVVCPLILVMLLVVVPGGGLERMYREMYYAGGDDLGPVAKQLRMLYATGTLLWGWEFLLRGFCLFGLARILGPGPAIFIQMVPFALLHMGKPEIEAMSTWLSGVGFGFVAWRTQSFIYVFLIHWFMLVMTVFVATGAFG